MFVKQEDVDSQPVKADICIIGGGPAAISIAKRLIGSHHQVVMLVGGGQEEGAADRDLNRGLVPVKGNHEPLEENRRRQFGGASAVWGGRCIALNPLDFQKRSWVEHSGWPITYADLEPYYAQALEVCEAGTLPFDARQVFDDEPEEIIAGMDDAELASWPMERWSSPTNFATSYGVELGEAKNIHVFLDSHAVELVCDDLGSRVTTVHAVRAGRRFPVRAATFILATGGIENARLLLASKTDRFPRGIGNDHDLLGRFYMCHLNGTYAMLDPADRKHMLYRFRQDRTGVYTRRRWWITSEAQRTHRIGNLIFFVFRPLDSNGHRDALFSAVYLAKTIQGLFRAPGVENRRTLWHAARTDAHEHLRNVLANSLRLLPELLTLIRLRYGRGRRLPSVLPSLKERYLGLYFQSEHMPNRESRVTLSTDQRDAHGVPRAVVHVAFSDLDIQTVVEGHRIFMSRYVAADAGQAKYDEDALREYIRNRCSNFNSAAHHLGTTRMAHSRMEGVVDSQCKVHGIENLYVVGSSVFPTGGHANPTLTIVALALRLADHLRTTPVEQQEEAMTPLLQGQIHSRR